LPWVHLIALDAQFASGAFIVALIAKRWMLEIRERRAPELPDLSIEESDYGRIIAEEDRTEEEEQRNESLTDDRDNVLKADGDEGNMPRIGTLDERQRERYLHAFHLRKQRRKRFPWLLRDVRMSCGRSQVSMSRRPDQSTTTSARLRGTTEEDHVGLGIATRPSLRPHAWNSTMPEV
jgi:hypothetical protein